MLNLLIFDSYSFNSSRQSQSTTLHADYNYEINRRKPLSFDTIRKYASELYSQKTQIEQNKLHDCLEHGTKILDNMNELYAYLHSYGKMHQAKLNLAFDNILVGNGSTLLHIKLLCVIALIDKAVCTLNQCQLHRRHLAFQIVIIK